jgi:hypothetical protein
MLKKHHLILAKEKDVVRLGKFLGIEKFSFETFPQYLDKVWEEIKDNKIVVPFNIVLMLNQKEKEVE